MSINSIVLIVLGFLSLYALVCCVPMALIGNNRKIGFWASFWITFFTSPLVSLIVILLSTRNSEIEYQQEMLRITRLQAAGADPNSGYTAPIKHTTKTGSSTTAVLISILVCGIAFGAVGLKNAIESTNGSSQFNTPVLFNTQAETKSFPKERENVKITGDELILQLKDTPLDRIKQSTSFGDIDLRMTFDQYMQQQANTLDITSDSYEYTTRKDETSDEIININIQHVKADQFVVEYFITYDYRTGQFEFNGDWWGD